MTSLQLGLIAAGAVLVGGVIAYNWFQERRVRRRIREAFSPRAGDADAARDGALPAASAARVEPSLPAARAGSPVPENARRDGIDGGGQDDDDYEPPLEVHARIASEMAAANSRRPRRCVRPARRRPGRRAAPRASGSRRSRIRTSSAS